MQFCRSSDAPMWHDCGAYAAPCDGVHDIHECPCEEHADWQRTPDKKNPFEFVVKEGDVPHTAFNSVYSSVGASKAHEECHCRQCIYELMAEWFYWGWFSKEREGSMPVTPESLKNRGAASK